MNRLEWWGYRHVDGTLHLKRYFDRYATDDARESVFVDAWWGPFYADDYYEAINILKVKANQK